MDDTNVSKSDDEIIIEYESGSSKKVIERNEDLDYLFNKYLGDRKTKKSENSYEDDISSNPKILKLTCTEELLEGTTSFAKHNVDKNSKCNKNSNKEQQKLEKEKLRQEKLRIAEQKKEENKRNKAIKDALNNYYKNMRPENCLKFIRVLIDEKLSHEDFFKSIKEELEGKGITYETTSHTVCSIITWKRELDSHILDSNGQLINTSDGIDSDEVLVIMKWNDFLVHVHNETFISFIENLNTELIGKKIFMAIYGLEQYYQYQKRQKNRDFKESITNKESMKYRDQKICGDIPPVSRRAVEYALTEIQLLFTISHKMIETKQDIASLVFQMTKSIAQAPYKKEKQEKFIQASWFMLEDKKNCIKVDKNGNGLSKLWKQVICTFPQTSLETAEAIASVYPTPSMLFQGYDKVTSISEGENLLQDIPIRRAVGPVTAMRKIGPELSKKIYNLFTAKDPNTFL